MARVLIILAQGCEELEAVTVIDLLRRANIDVITAGLDNQAVKASRGTVLIPDAELNDVAEGNYDMIVLPGGLPGADNLNESSVVHELLKKMQSKKLWISAICAAPKVLARAGLLENKKYTCYPGSVNAEEAKGHATENVVVVDENIVTSRGPGTAMDFALTLIELLLGKEAKNNVEKPLVRP